MKKEKLIIRNFGPIKDVELDLGRFNILIGEQATGKSTVAKLLAVCRYFSYIYEQDPAIHYDIFKKGLTAWGLLEYLKDNTYVSYSCVHYSLVYERFTYLDYYADENGVSEEKYERKEFSFDLTPLSSDFRNLLDELEKIKPGEEDFEDKNSAGYGFKWLNWIPTSFFLNDVKKVMDNPFYLPTQRGLQSIFSLGQNSIQNLSDALFNQLAKVDGIVRNFTNETYIEPLDIYYKNVRGHGYIRKANETEYYSLFNAASGYQSEIPIVLVIKYYNELKKRSKTFLIEEPEQNLFPRAQYKLVQYLVEQTVNSGSNILLTTQSPYIQTSVNNMMYAYQVGQKYPEKVSKEIDKKYWLNPDEVSAYRMLNDGTAKNILDDELKQIDAGEVDEVSRDINEKWDQLSDIKHGK